jgi:hypothetical protein
MEISLLDKRMVPFINVPLPEATRKRVKGRGIDVVSGEYSKADSDLNNLRNIDISRDFPLEVENDKTRKVRLFLMFLM